MAKSLSKKKVAILTSGGDASSMNKVLSTFVIYGNDRGIETYFVYNGFKGLYNNVIKKVTPKDVRGIHDKPGTIIKSSRFPEFKDEEIRKVAANNLKQKGIDTLIVCGGNGSYIGAEKLSKLGINVIALPGTIDNDIGSTELTIGFDTSLNTIIKNVNQIRATMESHNFITIVEIMGRECPDLTVFAGMACEVDYVVTKDNILTPEQFYNVIKKLRHKNKESIVILVTELLYGKNGNVTLQELCSYLNDRLGEKVRLSILGYLQRGATPTGIDLYIASIITAAAIDHYLEGHKNFAVGMRHFKEHFYDLSKAISMKSKNRMQTINKFINRI